MSEELQVIDNKSEETAIYLLTKAEIDTQIATAKAFPRSLTKFRDKALSMATFSEDVAASCTYALPRSGKNLEGPSIRLAEIIAASYTNIQYGGRVISNDGKTIIAQGVCIDLENNVKGTVEVSRSILDRYGKTFKQDMQVVTGNAAIAIAVRNAIFKVIPAAFVSDIQEKAKEVARGTAETLVSRRNKAVEYFRSIGVTDKQLCDTLEIQKVEDIDLDKLSTLTGFKAAIKNGESTIKDIFETKEENANATSYEDLVTAYDLKIALLSETEVSDAQRIINNREVNSYSKLMKLLNSK